MSKKSNHKQDGLTSLRHDTSVCRWSVQEDGRCPYREIAATLLSELSDCSGMSCRKLLTNKYGEVSDIDLINRAGLQQLLKPAGPAFSTNILNNMDIDSVLQDISIASLTSPLLKNGPFYHIPFDMSDFMSVYRSELRDIDFNRLASLKFKTFGCVLNTDVWSGPGKHWVCIFGTISDTPKGIRIDVEYFNSSGNGLDQYPSLYEWIEFKRSQSYEINIREIIHHELQQSNTECGVWCLYYIKSRIEGHKPNYFITSGVTDDDITSARRYIFT